MIRGHRNPTVNQHKVSHLKFFDGCFEFNKEKHQYVGVGPRAPPPTIRRRGGDGKEERRRNWLNKNKRNKSEGRSRAKRVRHSLAICRRHCRQSQPLTTQAG